MAREQFVSPPLSPSRDKKFWLQGDIIIFKVTGEDTQGKYAVCELVVPPDSSNPPHVHSREDESFYVVNGEFSFLFKGNTFTATKGTYLHLQKGVVHTYKNVGRDTGRLLVTVIPAGLEKLFAELGTQIADEKTFSPPPDPDAETIAAISAKYGLTYVPSLK